MSNVYSQGLIIWVWSQVHSMSLFRGRGLKLRCDSRSELMRFDIVPDIVFLQVGENDVVAATNSNKLAEDIISLAQYLWDGVGVKLVSIGQLLRRMQFASCRDFNATAMETNQHLKLRSCPLCTIHHWRHSGFWNDLQYLDPDGVRLLCTPDEDQPMRKYRRSIRNAVIRLSKSPRPAFIIMIMLARLHLFINCFSWAFR